MLYGKIQAGGFMYAIKYPLLFTEEEMPLIRENLYIIMRLCKLKHVGFTKEGSMFRMWELIDE